jgi:antitoxin (DNA-binding transcriptional repressor) of toxin-antitoxin stability system
VTGKRHLAETAMPRVDLREAQAKLPELIESLLLGEELTLLRDGDPIAKLIKLPPRETKPRMPGSAIGKLVIVEDDDSHLEDFREYM